MEFLKLILQNVIWRGLYFVSVFVVNILIARKLTATGSGEIFYIINNLSFLILVVGLSLESGASYYISKRESGSRKISLVLLAWSLAGSILILTLFKLLFKIPGNPLISAGESDRVYYPYIAGVLLTTYFSALFFAKKKFVLPNLISFFINLIFIALLIGSNDKVSTHNLIILYFYSFFAQGFFLLLFYYFSPASRDDVRVEHGTGLKKVFNYSMLALAANIIFFLVYRSDYWFVNQYCPLPDLGNYIQVSKLVQIFLLIPAMCANVIFPTIASSEKQREKSIEALSSVLFLVFLALHIVIAATGKQLFPLVFGSSFTKMYVPYLLLIPGALSLSALALLGAFFAGKNMIKINIAGACITLAIIIAGNMIFVPRYGINAAALTSSIGYTANLVFLLTVYCRNYKISAIHFFIPPAGILKTIRGLI
jgi:O-antigen/teichoic acid export membrane protein